MGTASESPPVEIKPRQGKTAPQLVSRLLGMETEYATLVAGRPDLTSSELPASAKIYARICAAIRGGQPTVPGVFDQDQLFLASGGAVTFESHPSLHSLPGGLVEIATPEVRSPDELLACQRSIDELVAKAATEATQEIDLRVLKNSTDALGHVYGCQENYEAIVASGLWLLIYRCCIVLLWGLQVVSMLAALPVLSLAFAMVMLIRFRGVHFFSRIKGLDSPESSDSNQSPGELFETLPKWVKSTLTGMLRLVHLPTVFILRLVARHVAFRKQRKYLTALLVSRVSICGTGDLDHDGRYRLSAKAMAIDTVSDMGSYNGERPIYVYGHWLGQFCAKSFLSLTSTKAMLHRRQRFQLGLSDSNLSELAEYVKLGSVSLILDMIESGVTKDFITLDRPIDALHDITTDWNLVRRVKTSRGKLSALEIQRRYLKSAREFVSQTPPESVGEAALVIERWSELINVVAAFRRDARNVIPALGRVDWLSKRWMMDQLGSDSQWVSRKKTDLRYHELSPDGYYRKLIAMNPSLALITQERIEKRRRTPPPDSPATKRGWLIREFAGGDQPVSCDWSYAVIGEGKQRKRIQF
ncbi:proteasome accessory factor PafA2 family protein [Stieleria sp. TO1_6]|uniref:proteasome accessory factor PafA2 family protein n=1 Tax=Stieleria tagensis TaxID=2956795 RepID=UPI00209B7238|nr:proteasome accessory factor PafA2 family protein [Stieleria tagensis]MCO8120580.1 proteasome accessory factor PafA2 family protein [Stieleria tagensis]